MIKDYESRHGSVIVRLLHSAAQELTLKELPEYGNGVYRVGHGAIVYIKYSSNRLSPWLFSFSQADHVEVCSLHTEFKRVVVALVCGSDGIAAIDFDEFENLLSTPSGKVGWISCSRNRRTMYSIKGSEGELNYKVADSQFEKLLVSENNQPSLTTE